MPQNVILPDFTAGPVEPGFCFQRAHSWGGGYDIYMRMRHPLPGRRAGAVYYRVTRGSAPGDAQLSQIASSAITSDMEIVRVVGSTHSMQSLRDNWRCHLRECHGYKWLLPNGEVVVSVNKWSTRHGPVAMVDRHGVAAIRGPDSTASFVSTRARRDNPRVVYLVRYQDYMNAPERWRNPGRTQVAINQIIVRVAEGNDVPLANAPQVRPEGRHWMKIGMELEGGWNADRNDVMDMASARGAKLVGDGSVEVNAETDGEINTKPRASLEEALADLVALHPDEANKTCGFHIHVSFVDEDYAKLADQKFYFYFLLRWQKWGEAQGFPADHQFWKRWLGKNNYCYRRFSAAPQIATAYKDECRYAQLNYCYQIHKTLECRMLPMFESSEDSCKALTELISIYEDYLTMVHDEPAIPDLDIQDTHIVGGEAIEVIELDGRTMIVEEINLAAHVPTMDESVVWIPGPRTNVAQQLRRMVAEQGRYYGMNNEVDDEDDFDFEDDY